MSMSSTKCKELMARLADSPRRGERNGSICTSLTGSKTDGSFSTSPSMIRIQRWARSSSGAMGMTTNLPTCWLALPSCESVSKSPRRLRLSNRWWWSGPPHSTASIGCSAFHGCQPTARKLLAGGWAFNTNSKDKGNTMAIKSPFDPSGMSGLYVAPWTPDEFYGVGGDWSQPSSQIFSLECGDEWNGTQYQVADFASRWAALAQILRDVVRHGGDEIDDAEIDSAVKVAIEF